MSFYRFCFLSGLYLNVINECLLGAGWIVGVSVLQTHLSLLFCSLGHSFISPTSDFRKTKRKYEKKAFWPSVWSAPWLSRHASLIALGHQSLFSSASFRRPLRQQSSSSSYFIFCSLPHRLSVCVLKPKENLFFIPSEGKALLKKVVLEPLWRKCVQHKGICYSVILGGCSAEKPFAPSFTPVARINL